MTKPCVLLPLALLLGACGSASIYRTSQEHARLRNFTLAYDVLEQERQRRVAAGEEIDQEFADAHRNARLAYLLDRAQWRIFLENEDEALVDLSAVLTMYPDHAAALELRDRALHKKASRAAARGDEFLVKNELEQALAAYIEAERSVPGYPPAAEGSEKVRAAVDRMSARAQKEFLEAVRKMPEFRYVEVRWHASNAVTNDKSRDDAESLRARARRELAQREIEEANACIAADQYGAALMHFREAKQKDETLPGIDLSIRRMEREVEAARLVDAARMDMRSGFFEIAREQLGKALALSDTPRARASISEAMLEARRLEGELQYKKGRDQELLGKKQAALAAYEKLVASWPEGLLDERARIEALKTDIAAAAEELAAAEQAEAAGDLPGALEHLLAAERFCADYQDLPARIAKLRERIAAAGGGNGG